MTAPDVLPTRRATPTRRAVKGQVRADRTRQLIIDETIRCVREEGFAAISASRIAERYPGPFSARAFDAARTIPYAAAIPMAGAPRTTIALMAPATSVARVSST